MNKSPVIRPSTLLLEASSVCQLACPSCPTADGKIKDFVKSGFLKLDLFKQIVDRNPTISDIELSNWGEILLNPELIQIMEYAYIKGVKLTAANGVNLNTASDSTLEALVSYRFRFLNCSIDGATPDVYAIYRRRGNLDHVLENVRKINQFKKKHNSPYPKLRWQFVVHGHNEHEIEAARELADQLNMEFFLKLQWDDLYSEAFSPVRDKERVRSLHPNQVANRSEYKSKYGRNYVEPCFQLWRSPQINFDGKILGCCVNHWGDFGVVDGGDVQAAVNNEKISYAREMLKGTAPEREGIPCSSCSLYKEKLQNKEWLSEVETMDQEAIPKILGSARTYNILVSRFLTATNKNTLEKLRSWSRAKLRLR